MLHTIIKQQTVRTRTLTYTNNHLLLNLQCTAQDSRFISKEQDQIPAQAQRRSPLHVPVPGVARASCSQGDRERGHTMPQSQPAVPCKERT